jgi:predicted PurR-regulated permease PerM
MRCELLERARTASVVLSLLLAPDRSHPRCEPPLGAKEHHLRRVVRLAGAPQALAWGVLTIVASVVPVLGPSLVWAPVAAFFLLQGRPGAAGFVVVWGLLVVMALSDYVIRPRLVGNSYQGHPLLTLLGLLGGLAIFGLAGLVVGPVIMSLFVAIFRICERERLEGASGP